MILMLAPAPNKVFGAQPSGATYVSDQYGLIKITNDSTADQAALAAAGCYTLSPFGGWGTYGFTSLADVYSADAASGLLLPGVTGFPPHTVVTVFNDSGNTGTWNKTGTGSGSGNWTQVSTSTAVSAAIAAAASADAAAASAASVSTGSLFDNIAATDTDFQAISTPNVLNNGDFSHPALAYPQRRSNSSIVQLDTQVDLTSRGYTGAFRWRTGGNEFVRLQYGSSLANLYVVTAFLAYSNNPTHLPSETDVYTESADGLTLTGLAATPAETSGQVALSSNCNLYWHSGRVGAADTHQNLLFGSAFTGNDTDPTYATGFFFYLSSSAPSAASIVTALQGVLAFAKSQGDIRSIMTDALIGQNVLAANIQSNVKAFAGATPELTDLTAANVFLNGDFGATPYPERRSGSYVLDLNTTIAPDLVARGFTRAFRWYTGSSEFARYYSGSTLQNKYVLGAFLAYSADPTHLPAAAAIFTEAAPTSMTGLPDVSTPTAVSSGVINISPNLVLVWAQVKVTVDQSRLIVGASYSGTDTGPTYATGFYAAVSSSLIADTSIILQMATEIANLGGRHSIAVANAAEQSASPLPFLVLNGVGTGWAQYGPVVESYVQACRGAWTLRRTFAPWASLRLLQAQPFNILRDIIVGAGGGGADLIYRDCEDDITPVRAMSSVSEVGAHHGYRCGLCTVAAHGKTTADVGSVWSNGGSQFIILGIYAPDTLIIADTVNDTNTAFSTGLFTHVSGGTNVANFTVSVVGMQDFYPPYQNYVLEAFLDGAPLTPKVGRWEYRDTVSFRESYQILDRADVIAWFEANGSSGGIQPTSATPALNVCVTYEFDRDANLTIYSEVTPLKTETLREIMTLQGGAMVDGSNTPFGDGAPTRYIPKITSVTAFGHTYNWANIDVIDTSGWSGQLDLPPGDFAGSGNLADRSISLTANYGYAQGFIPVLSADPSVRRTLCAARVMSISNAAAKTYMYAVSSGAITTLNKGDCYATIGYRNIFKRESARTAFYTVRTRDADYLYADWHNLVEVDQVKVPSDFVGRSFTVVESLNATVLSKSLTSQLTVDVSTSGTYGYLVLKIT